MNKISSINKIISFGIILLVAVIVNISCNGGAAKVAEQKPQIILRSYDEARAYIVQVLEKTIPVDYKAPDYIYSNMNKDQKYEQFGKRYPQFYGLGSTDLLDSVIAYPHLYETMIIENRALRASVTK